MNNKIILTYQDMSLQYADASILNIKDILLQALVFKMLKLSILNVIMQNK